MGKHINETVKRDSLTFDSKYLSASLNPKNARHRAFIEGDRVQYSHTYRGLIEAVVVSRPNDPYTDFPAVRPLDAVAGITVYRVSADRLTLVQSAHSDSFAA